MFPFFPWCFQKIAFVLAFDPWKWENPRWSQRGNCREDMGTAVCAPGSAGVPRGPPGGQADRAVLGQQGWKVDWWHVPEQRRESNPRSAVLLLSFVTSPDPLWLSGSSEFCLPGLIPESLPARKVSGHTCRRAWWALPWLHCGERLGGKLVTVRTRNAVVWVAWGKCHWGTWWRWIQGTGQEMRCRGEMGKGDGDSASRRKAWMGDGSTAAEGWEGAGTDLGAERLRRLLPHPQRCTHSRGAFAPRCQPGAWQSTSCWWDLTRLDCPEEGGCGWWDGREMEVVLRTPTYIYCCGWSDTSVWKPLCFLLWLERNATWKFTFPYVYVMCSTLSYSNKYYVRHLINELHNVCFPILCDHQPKHRQVACQDRSGTCNCVFSIYDANCTWQLPPNCNPTLNCYCFISAKEGD